MIGQLIRTAREELGWAEERLSRESGLSLDTIAGLENDAHDHVPLHIYERVCVPLGIELPMFLTVRAEVDPQRLGNGIRTLRHRLEQSRGQLAESTGVSETTVADLERGTLNQNSGALLEQIAMGLELSLSDLCFIVFDSPNTRRIRGYNVGIGKSGTMSMARIFSRYASRHEFLSEQTLRRTFTLLDGEIDDRAMEKFLQSRDRLGNLEFDSAGFHANYIESLVRLCPDACFVVTIRDCYSWLDSFLNTILDYAPGLPGWRFDGVYARNFGLTREVVNNSDLLAAVIPGIVDRLLDAWAYPNRQVLNAVPESKRLIVKTNEISESLQNLASFIGVAVETLDAEESHSNMRPERLRCRLLETVEEQIVEESVRRTCADLMGAYFPEHTLARYLDA